MHSDLGYWDSNMSGAEGAHSLAPQHPTVKNYPVQNGTGAKTEKPSV